MTPLYDRTTPTDRISPEHTPRLRLKPKAPHSGYVDGAWWPHTSNLSNELPDLLAVLSVRLGQIDRVLYNVGEWSSAPTKLATGGRRVRLDGYQRQPRNTVEVVGLDRDKIVLLTVPASTDPAEAHSALMSAARPNNRSTVLDILTTAQHAD
ncbi:hypothetical protein FZI85_14340 [Mycobacterium sp. CBMA293]|uniref:DUF5994 family protein n=1 Tax=unclassified Mycolicibacterium TaxID=2636767 RepID=UPI0012DF24F1|nr:MULTISPECIES: DUF5994 family protein [unclassified Mycolicibacterium]MUL48202.1 hypothetical protein [Mycolicibacterium sp. CBMA 360]MUL57629.1 hypothetical protein [Mycolicibacterium sp. CBMA 335]MUL70669.1 hypothetical protein [Mycolicibacterium sp. CBMA 311]MUL92717.1 hypothetical protein [Mycolicibacterium sp. CBMA 230]MUM08268.1 hypothetical protein [Mycolicibacterium sp. CBMA 213]